jgi:hypothetical protein
MVSSLTSESLSPMPSTPRLIVPESSSEMISAAREEELNKTWEMWDLIRSICDYDTRLTLSESRILLFGGGHQIHVFSP